MSSYLVFLRKISFNLFMPYVKLLGKSLKNKTVLELLCYVVWVCLRSDILVELKIHPHWFSWVCFWCAALMFYLVIWCLVDDTVGIPYYFEIMILILITAFLYDCNNIKDAVVWNLKMLLYTLSLLYWIVLLMAFRCTCLFTQHVTEMCGF